MKRKTKKHEQPVTQNLLSYILIRTIIMMYFYDVFLDFAAVRMRFNYDRQ